MHTWSVERAVHRGCGIVRGAAAVLLAPVFDWVCPNLEVLEP